MLKKELAAALSISPAMVSKLAKRGMPTDTLERAQRWRRRHLEPGRVKGVRLEDPKAIPTDPVARANAIGAAAVAAFETHERELREALRAVPAERRQEVALDFDVWGLLYGSEDRKGMVALWEEEKERYPDDERRRVEELMWGWLTDAPN
jgi:hypothetical protein